MSLQQAQQPLPHYHLHRQGDQEINSKNHHMARWALHCGHDSSWFYFRQDPEAKSNSFGTNVVDVADRCSACQSGKLVLQFWSSLPANQGDEPQRSPNPYLALRITSFPCHSHVVHEWFERYKASPGSWPTATHRVSWKFPCLDALLDIYCSVVGDLWLLVKRRWRHWGSCLEEWNHMAEVGRGTRSKTKDETTWLVEHLPISTPKCHRGIIGLISISIDIWLIPKALEQDGLCSISLVICSGPVLVLLWFFNLSSSSMVFSRQWQHFCTWGAKREAAEVLECQAPEPEAPKAPEAPCKKLWNVDSWEDPTS